MKKTTKAFVIMAALAVFGTTGLFAHPKSFSKTGTEFHVKKNMDNGFKSDFKTVAATVKVVSKKDFQVTYLKLKDGRTYIADSIGPEGNKAIQILAKRNGKKAVVSGVLNENTGVFNIVKLGGFENKHNGVVDEK